MTADRQTCAEDAPLAYNESHLIGVGLGFESLRVYMKMKKRVGALVFVDGSLSLIIKKHKRGRNQNRSVEWTLDVVEAGNGLRIRINDEELNKAIKSKKNKPLWWNR